MSMPLVLWRLMLPSKTTLSHYVFRAGMSNVPFSLKLFPVELLTDILHASVTDWAAWPSHEPPLVRVFPLWPIMKLVIIDS